MAHRTTPKRTPPSPGPEALRNAPASPAAGGSLSSGHDTHSPSGSSAAPRAPRGDRLARAQRPDSGATVAGIGQQLAALQAEREAVLRNYERGRRSEADTDARLTEIDAHVALRGQPAALAPAADTRGLGSARHANAEPPAGTPPAHPVSLLSSGAARKPRNEEDVKHSDDVWTHKEDAAYSLVQLREAYREYLAGRPKPASPQTIRTYVQVLETFRRSLDLHGDEAVLGNLTVANVNRWVADLRQGRLPTKKRGHPSKGWSESSIGSYVIQLKVFSHAYVYEHLEMTTRDLLARVDRYEAKVPVKQGLTQEQLDTVFTSFSDDDPLEIRDRAFVAIVASTGLRFEAVLDLDLDQKQVDKYSGEIHTTDKGGEERYVIMSQRALRYLRAWLRIRPEAESRRIFLSRSKKPLTYDGGQQIFRRVKRRSGVDIANCHRFRHTWTQGALKKGAERQLVQDAMGWKSDAMVRRYAGWVRAETAAKAMPKFSPI